MISGCSSIPAMFSKGADINDNALIAAEAVICKGSSIGSVMRRYGVNENKAKAWKELCSNHNNEASTILSN